MICASRSAGACLVLAERLDRVEPALEHLLERVLALGILQRDLAGEHVVEHAAEEEDVGARVSLGAQAGPLERRVIDGALAGDPVPLVPLDRGQPEVDELGRARVGDQDVGRLEVAVSDPLLVRVLQAPGQADHERQRLLVLEPDAELEELAEVRSPRHIP